MNPQVSAKESENATSFRQIQAIVQDLKQPNPFIYWVDFLTTIICGHLLFKVLVFAGRWWPDDLAFASAVRIVSYPLVVLLYLRAAMFIHELVHLPKDQFKLFRIAWNGLCGVFFLIPSFTYYPHIDHHRRHTYGTEHDGEYLPLSHRPVWFILGFLLQGLVVPLLGFLRFFVLSPICWCIPGARRWVHRHASTMVVDPFYGRSPPSPKETTIVVLQELGCFTFCAVFFYRGLWYWNAWLSPLWVAGYLVGVGVVTLNAIRTLGAHRWTGAGEAMDVDEQILDSVNYPHRPYITELWGPVGTRYHALHHLLPSLPYHNMPEAHRRLMRELPMNAPYRKTERLSLFSEICTLWQRARESRHPNGSSWTNVHVA